MSALRRLRTQPLRLKLMLLAGGMTALVVAGSFLVLRTRAIGDVRLVFADELARSQRALRGLQERDLSLLLATSNLVTTSPTLRAALETARSEANAGLPARAALLATIRREAERVFQELDRDLLVVTDDQGRALVSVGRGDLPPQLPRLPAVRHALQSEAPRADSSFGVLTVDGEAFQVGSAAIVLQGFPIGVLVMGDRLSKLLPQFGAMGGDVVITSGQDVLASRPQRAADDVRAAGLTEPVTDTLPRRVRFGREEYVAASLSLGATPAGVPVTLHVLRSLGGAIGPLERTLGRSFLLAGLAAVLVATLGAAAAARTTLGPLNRFVRFLETGAEQGTVKTYTAEPGQPAEVEALTESYNSLIASLARQHEQLEEKSHQLSSANDSLTEEIRQRTRVEEELKASEEALRQSQKLEALGTLAGGVAHDFNNLITVITGYAELLTRELPSDSPMRTDIEQIDQAAERASGLVRQLLAFSRKQVLQPRIMDLNHVVSGMEKMLSRLVPEDVALQTQLEPRLARINADPGSIEQVLMNLVVNARDAMPRGGRVRIETANVTLGSAYEHRPEAVPAGPAVMLAVSDTGVGMDDATRARIFEPFFTTKGPGKGTGLGLSTVYGIVKQSGGNISVYSKPGDGSTFRVYFPVATRAAESAAPDDGDQAWPRGTETVLVTEDEEQVRAFVKRSLEQQGYKVLPAGHGAEALALSESYAGPIHLLLTDVVMPSMSGQELSRQLREQRPGLPVIFLSGYSAEAIAHHGRLAPDSLFLQKPVSPARLARAVREALDANGK